MSRKLPEELVPVLARTGHRWPLADEEGLRRAAGLWREFGTEADRLAKRGGDAARRVTGDNSGRAVEAFAAYWQAFQGGGKGHLDDAHAAAGLVAGAFDAAARAVDSCKADIVAALNELAAELKKAEEQAAAAKASTAQTAQTAPGAGGPFDTVRRTVDAAAEQAARAVAAAAVEAAGLKIGGLLDELGRAMKDGLGAALREPAVIALLRLAPPGAGGVRVAGYPGGVGGAFDPVAAGLPAALGEPGVLGGPGGTGLAVVLGQDGKPVVGVPGLAVKLDEAGRPVLDANGEPVIVRADGTPVADADGLVVVAGADGRPVVGVENLAVKLDEHGRPVLGKDGQPVLTGEDGREITGVPLAGPSAGAPDGPGETGGRHGHGHGAGPGAPGEGGPVTAVAAGVDGVLGAGASGVFGVSGGEPEAEDAVPGPGPSGHGPRPGPEGPVGGGGGDRAQAGPGPTPVHHADGSGGGGGSGASSGSAGSAGHARAADGDYLLPPAAAPASGHAPVPSPGPAAGGGGGYVAAPLTVRTDSVLAPPAPQPVTAYDLPAPSPAPSPSPAPGLASAPAVSGWTAAPHAAAHPGPYAAPPGAGGGGAVGPGPLAVGATPGGSGAHGPAPFGSGIGAGTPVGPSPNAPAPTPAPAPRAAAGAAHPVVVPVGAPVPVPVPVPPPPPVPPTVGPGAPPPAPAPGGGTGPAPGPGRSDDHPAGHPQHRRRTDAPPADGQPGLAWGVVPVATAHATALHLAMRALRADGVPGAPVVRLRTIADSRPTGLPGGLGPVDPEHQREIERRAPRAADGLPVRHPDPAAGGWTEVVNDGGYREPGRANNSLEIALSAVDTFTGRPTCAAPRVPTEGDAGERGGRDRAERELGAPFRDLGDGDQAFARLAGELRRAGHGAQAVLLTLDGFGRPHAWNAVYHQDAVTYLDHQAGRRAPAPLHPADHGLWAIALTPEGRPLDLLAPTS
ncbi:toxin glutamine deamidase domain-containing protein [Kitasatospora sp. NPDC057500]|uniref:toxin glutamine deamidase domain-containing protein n=1 Tax=Kitasatospora sp. NPDC057500 TaxID=3346151 RepID=UPI0036B521E6